MSKDRSKPVLAIVIEPSGNALAWLLSEVAWRCMIWHDSILEWAPTRFVLCQAIANVSAGAEVLVFLVDAQQKFQEI